MSGKKKNKLHVAFNYLEKIIVVIGGIAIILMMLLIVSDVVLRNVANSPVRGGKELVELLMVATIFFGMSYTQKEDGHIGIDFITAFLKGFPKKIIDIVLLLLSLFINGFLTYFVYVQMTEDYRRGVATIYLQWPQWIITMLVLIGMFLLSVRLFIELIISFKTEQQIEITPEELGEGEYHD